MKRLNLEKVGSPQYLTTRFVSSASVVVGTLRRPQLRTLTVT